MKEFNSLERIIESLKEASKHYLAISSTGGHTDHITALSIYSCIEDAITLIEEMRFRLIEERMSKKNEKGNVYERGD